MQASNYKKATQEKKEIKQAKNVMTTRHFPIYGFSMTKCACTFLRTLFYRLEHGCNPEDPSQVHRSGGGVYHSNKTPNHIIRNSPYAFAVIRHPLDRFLSLYFDKIYGDSTGHFPHIQNILVERGLNRSKDINLEDHTQNYLIFAHWLHQNLQRKTSEPVNPHWKPQSSHLKRVRYLNLRYLTIDNISRKLIHLLEPMIPNIADDIKQVNNSNKSIKPKKWINIATKELKFLIKEIYKDDLIIFQQARQDPINSDLVEADAIKYMFDSKRTSKGTCFETSSPISWLDHHRQTIRYELRTCSAAIQTHIKTTSNRPCWDA